MIKSYQDLIDSDKGRLASLGPMKAIKTLAASARVLLGKIKPIPRSMFAFSSRMNAGFISGELTGIQTASYHQAESLTFNLHASMLWADSGYNIFRLTEDLAAAFALTDVDTATAEFKFPYPGFYVVLPPGILAYFGDATTEWVRMILVSSSMGRTTLNGEEEPYYYQSCVSESGRVIWSKWPVGYIVKNGLGGAPVEQEVIGADHAHQNDDITTNGAIRITLNLVRWLEAVGGKSSSHITVKRLSSKCVTWDCGQGIELQTQLKRSVSERALGNAIGSSWQLRVRHIVRGHWKLQASGEGRNKRTRIFVEPYWRGPEGSEAWDRVYECGEEDKEA